MSGKRSRILFWVNIEGSLYKISVFLSGSVTLLLSLLEDLRLAALVIFNVLMSLLYQIDVHRIRLANTEPDGNNKLDNILCGRTLSGSDQPIPSIWTKVRKMMLRCNRRENFVRKHGGPVPEPSLVGFPHLATKCTWKSVLGIMKVTSTLKRSWQGRRFFTSIAAAVNPGMPDSFMPKVGYFNISFTLTIHKMLNYPPS